MHDIIPASLGISAPFPSDLRAWEIVECAVDLIAGHYQLDRDLVWAAVFDLEDSWEEQTGFSNFGVLLDHPCGFTTLGLRAAGLILGEAEAEALPPLMLSYH